MMKEGDSGERVYRKQEREVEDVCVCFFRLPDSVPAA